MRYLYNIITNYGKKILLRCFRYLIFRKKVRYEKKYDVVICGIFKNEAAYLKEWITYHLMIGFDHLFLYNNNSTDNYKEVLEEFISDGKVTLIEWPYAQGQIDAYKHFYENFSGLTQWGTFLDIDEFYVPRSDDNIKTWLKKHDRWPVLLVYWKMFGTCGKLTNDLSKPIIEQYVNCWPSLIRCGKCFFNTDYPIAEFSSGTHHRTKVRFRFLGKSYSMYPINSFGKLVFNEKEVLISDRLSSKADIQINHYWSRSWESYDTKRKMIGDVFFKNNPKNKIEYFLKNETRNTSSDFTIYRFLLMLKWRLESMEITSVDTEYADSVD